MFLGYFDPRKLYYFNKDTYFWGDLLDKSAKRSSLATPVIQPDATQTGCIDEYSYRTEIGAWGRVLNRSSSALFKDHCCRFSRNIAQITPKMIYIYYQKNKFLGSQYPNKYFLFIYFEKNFIVKDPKKETTSLSFYAGVQMKKVNPKMLLKMSYVTYIINLYIYRLRRSPRRHRRPCLFSFGVISFLAGYKTTVKKTCQVKFRKSPKQSFDSTFNTLSHCKSRSDC